MQGTTHVIGLAAVRYILLLCLIFFDVQVAGDEPIWRQVLRRLVNDRDLQGAQQAAAALAM